MKQKDIVDAWAQIRGENNTIPDDVLDFMKDAALQRLSGLIGESLESNTGYTRVDVLGEEGVEVRAKAYADKEYPMQQYYQNNIQRGFAEVKHSVAQSAFIAGSTSNQDELKQVTNDMNTLAKMESECMGWLVESEKKIKILEKGFNKIIDIVKRYRDYDGQTSIGNHIENECKEILATLISEDKGEEKEEAK